MPDLDKVIKGLRCHSEPKFELDEYFCETCPYDELTCSLDVPADALSLLKAQDAQSVLSNRVCEAEPFRYVRKGFCPKCHQEMEWLFNRKHCGFCGQAVKWE